MNGDWIGQCNRVARVGRSISRVLQAPSRPEGTFVLLKTGVMAPAHYPRANNTGDRVRSPSRASFVSLLLSVRDDRV